MSTRYKLKKKCNLWIWECVNKLEMWWIIPSISPPKRLIIKLILEKSLFFPDLLYTKLCPFFQKFICIKKKIKKTLKAKLKCLPLYFMLTQREKKFILKYFFQSLSDWKRKPSKHYTHSSNFKGPGLKLQKHKADLKCA